MIKLNTKSERKMIVVDSEALQDLIEAVVDAEICPPGASRETCDDQLCGSCWLQHITIFDELDMLK